MNDKERLAAIGLAPPAWTGGTSFVEPVPSEWLRDRYRGCLLGGAIGDALGRPVETWPRWAVRETYPEGLRDFVPWRGYRSGPVGTFTDDTQLSVVIARWLVSAGQGDLDPDWLAREITLWGRTGRGIGHATRQALSRLERGHRWWESGVPSAGNGAAMRAAPYALRYVGLSDRLRHAAALGSVPTHADVTAVASAIMQAALVSHCLSETPDRLDPAGVLEVATASVADLDLPALGHRGDGTRRTLVERVAEVGDLLGRDAATVFDHFFNGAFVLETMPVVVWCLLTHADDPEEALVTAVMGGRDSDTIGAMLGNLLGALHGTEGFPSRWRGENLEDHDELVALADALYDLRWPPSG